MTKRMIIALIVAKFTLLIAIFVFSRKISFGEMKLLGSDEKAPPPTAETLAAAPAQKASSILDDLLNLPQVNPDEKKKEEIEKYLQLANAAKQQVDDRIKRLEEKDQRLKSIEATIEKKLKALEDERNFFAQSVQKEKEIQEERLTKLVELYEKMEPKKAAPIFENLDKDLVISLFKKLKQKQVTLILETMKPERSKELTEYLGRVGSAREYELLKEVNVSLQEAFQVCKAN